MISNFNFTKSFSTFVNLPHSTYNADFYNITQTHLQTDSQPIILNTLVYSVFIKFVFSPKYVVQIQMPSDYKPITHHFN